MSEISTTDNRAAYAVAPDESDPGALRLSLTGSWLLQATKPAADQIYAELRAQSDGRRVVLDGTGLEAWDSGLLTFLLKLNRLSAKGELALDPSGLPEGAKRLTRLATAVPEQAGARRGAAADSFLTRVGKETLALIVACGEVVRFLGEVTIAFGRLLLGRARFRRSDLTLTIQEVGAQALPIVSLISFLVGVILAFLGSVQLLQFGAQIRLFGGDLAGGAAGISAARPAHPHRCPAAPRAAGRAG
jgi:phospholipid/cholesterol/gamma-HCH transport system permease protein